MRAGSINAPSLIWQASLAGRETVKFAGTGSGRIAVLAEPRPRIENGVYIPHSIQMVAFDIKSGAAAWRKEILGGDIITTADNFRLYMRLQLPLVSYDAFDFHNDEIRHEIVTFRWSDGRMGWHIPCEGTRSLFVWNGQVFYDEVSKNPYLTRQLVFAVNADTGKEAWFTRHGDIRGLFAAHDALYAYDESRDPEGETLHAIDPATGKDTQSLLLLPLFRPTTHLSALTWLPNVQVLVGAIEQNSTPGINAYQIRALDAGGKPTWDCQDVGRFQLVGDVLICQRYTQPHEYPRGILGLNPATGHELWRRSDITNDVGYMDTNIGEWRGQAVVLQDNRLIGLSPRTGKTAWTLDILPPGVKTSIQQAKIVGDVIVIAIGGAKDRPAQVRAYALRPSNR